jgi:hypothetical protein
MWIWLLLSCAGAPSRELPWEALRPVCDGGCGGEVTELADQSGAVKLLRHQYDRSLCSHGMTVWLNPSGVEVYRVGDKTASAEAIAKVESELKPLLAGLSDGRTIGCAEITSR